MDPTMDCGIPMMALTSSPSRNNSSGSIVNWKCSGLVCVSCVHYEALRIFRAGLSVKEHERVILTALHNENA
jgi:hypothetical protein